MAAKSEKDRLAIWQERTTAANKAYKKWEDKFRTRQLEEYWEGFQWEEQPEELSKQNYVINLVFPSIEIKKPSLLFYRPQFCITPKPARIDDPGSQIEDRAKLQQDTINTFVSDRRMGFQAETYMCLHEAFFRFGVAEVGYTGDFIDNPNADKPMLNDDNTEMIFNEEPVIQPKRIPNPKNPHPENIYIKRVPAEQFRVGLNSKNRLSRCDWVGYWEWNYISDVKANPNYKNTSKLKIGGALSKEYRAEIDNSETARESDGTNPKSDMIKVWKIWDLRTKQRHVFGDNAEKFFIEGESFEYHPFACLKFHERTKEWYPLPPVFNWIHPQNELNEIRNMQKVHRKRFYRRYLYLDGQIDIEELRKLEDGGDGVYAKASRTDALAPVQDAPLDPAIGRNVPESKEDLMEISGIGAEARGNEEPDTTATQANIVDVRARIREGYARLQVADWLSDIAWLILQNIKDHMALPFWVNISVDPLGPAATQETLRVAALWKQITAGDLGDIEHDISVDVQSLSPAASSDERNAWNAFLALMANPQLLMALMASEVLLRKTAGLYGIYGERDIREIQKAGQAVLQGLMMQAQAKAGGAAGNISGSPANNPQPGATPGPAEIVNQLQNQIGLRPQ